MVHVPPACLITRSKTCFKIVCFGFNTDGSWITTSEIAYLEGHAHCFRMIDPKNTGGDDITQQIPAGALTVICFKCPLPEFSCAAGWSPLCYAVLKGQVDIVKSLLKCRADCQDRTTKFKKAPGPANMICPMVNEHSYEKWPFIVRCPSKNGGFP